MFRQSAEWDMIQMDHGEKYPLFWSLEEQHALDDIRLIELDERGFERIDVRITDFYYLPKVNRIHFGLWYDAEKYDHEDIPLGVFEHVFIDDQGNQYEDMSFSIGPHSFYGQFHRRSTSGINIDDIQELYLYIYPIKNDQRLEPAKALIYSKDEALEKV
ncbi:hypothetical protein [Tenuibacillus multivorans]|nr:hypothetical protein [Tenuibacillus multivorans]